MGFMKDNNIFFYFVDKNDENSIVIFENKIQHEIRFQNDEIIFHEDFGQVFQKKSFYQEEKQRKDIIESFSKKGLLQKCSICDHFLVKDN